MKGEAVEGSLVGMQDVLVDFLSRFFSMYRGSLCVYAQGIPLYRVAENCLAKASIYVLFLYFFVRNLAIQDAQED